MRWRDTGAARSKSERARERERTAYRIIGSRGKCTSRPLCASLHRGGTSLESPDPIDFRGRAEESEREKSERREEIALDLKSTNYREVGRRRSYPASSFARASLSLLLYRSAIC